MFMELDEQLQELDASKAKMRTSRVVHRLGFTPARFRGSVHYHQGGSRAASRQHPGSI